MLFVGSVEVWSENNLLKATIQGQFGHQPQFTAKSVAKLVCKSVDNRPNQSYKSTKSVAKTVEKSL